MLKDWIKLELNKGERWALAEVCTLLGAILVVAITRYSDAERNENRRVSFGWKHFIITHNHSILCPGKLELHVLYQIIHYGRIQRGGCVNTVHRCRPGSAGWRLAEVTLWVFWRVEQFNDPKRRHRFVLTDLTVLYVPWYLSLTYLWAGESRNSKDIFILYFVSDRHRSAEGWQSSLENHDLWNVYVFQTC